MSIATLLPSSIGFGTAPLGNMFRDIPHADAAATIQAAWDQGLRYFDTAPLYGAGLAEIRLGEILGQYPREDYLLSTKVGRLVVDEPEDRQARAQQSKGDLFRHGRPNKVVADYTADGTLRSIAGSLDRLKTDRLDIVWVHDVGQDYHGDRWVQMYETAHRRLPHAVSTAGRRGHQGVGTRRRVEPLEITLDLDGPAPDAFLLAGRYTLLDHERALQRLLPAAQDQRVGIVVGGPYSSGILAGGAHFEYADAPPEILDKVARIKKLGDEHGIGIKSAALQFALAHPAVAAVIPGATRPSRIAEDIAASTETVPPAFWTALREHGLIAPNAPTPA